MRVRFKLDENLPAELADLFRQAGHDAVTVLDQTLVVEESRIRMRG